MNIIFGILFSLVTIIILVLIPWVGVWAFDLRLLFGVIIPYTAMGIFVLGVIIRVIDWARSPTPFRIPTTAGQQKSLPWIKHNRLDNPSGILGVLGRMFFEIVTFRSLFRNLSLEFRQGPKITYEWEKWLWIGALVFHYSFLIVILRHLRFFTDPIPGFVHLIEALDGFFEVGVPFFPDITSLPDLAVPGLLITGFVLPAGATYLLLRRLYLSQMRYISLPGDYFPLFLILGIATTGILMRYMGGYMQFALDVDWFTVPVVSVKELAMGLVTFSPIVPEGIGPLFFIHLFLVSTLVAYFPFSKLMHFGGIFLSPTRNLANNNRAVRHVNPWNYPVKTHTYDEYEDEFREKMIEAGLPVEKMPETAAEGEAESQDGIDKE